MAQTLREVCSDIINDVKAYNLDDRLSYRYVKNKLIDKAEYFVRQDAEARKLQKIIDLWQPIDCIDLVEVPANYCGDVSCKTVMKSVIKLPESYQTNYGNLIKVFNIDYTKEYTLTTPALYKDEKNRKFPSNKSYYWVIGGYIYIPDSTVEVISVLGMFKESLQNGCNKPLDSKFSFPDYIKTIAKQEVLKELLTGKQIPQDEKPNLNTNIKN